MTDKTAQRDFLTKAQAALDLSAPEMAAALETPFNTYRAWLYGRNPMPGVVAVAVRLLMEKKSKKEGKNA